MGCGASSPAPPQPTRPGHVAIPDPNRPSAAALNQGKGKGKQNSPAELSPEEKGTFEKAGFTVQYADWTTPPGTHDSIVQGECPAQGLLIAHALGMTQFTSILFFEPNAAGSGIPETCAFLNGVIIPKTFSLRVVFAKFASCALAVGSGIPAGPEGPM